MSSTFGLKGQSLVGSSRSRLATKETESSALQRSAFVLLKTSKPVPSKGNFFFALNPYLCGPPFSASFPLVGLHDGTRLLSAARMQASNFSATSGTYSC